jgi:hypothetical protein
VSFRIMGREARFVIGVGPRVNPSGCARLVKLVLRQQQSGPQACQLA